MRSGEEKQIKVQKKNPAGEVTYEYGGVLLNRDDDSIVIEAFFDREDRPFQNTILKKGDRFVEYYYSERWYNIFEIYDRDNGKLKGWYCNVGMPASFGEDIVSYIDLALDLWVSSDGEQFVLDEDEFAELNISSELRTGAQKGLQELQRLFENQNPPL